MSTQTLGKPTGLVRSTTKRPVKIKRWNDAVDSPDDQYQLKKDAVIAEAARAFGRHGDKNVSLDDIAKILNVTKPALYYYFKNKQELIYECHELAMTIGDRVLREATAAESTGYDRVTAFIKNYVSLLTNEMGAPAILHDFGSMTPADQKKITARRRQFDLELRQVLEDGVRDGSIAPCDCKLAVFWFMGAISTIPKWFHAEGGLSGEQVADIFTGFLARGIQPTKSSTATARKTRASPSKAK